MLKLSGTTRKLKLNDCWDLMVCQHGVSSTPSANAISIKVPDDEVRIKTSKARKRTAFILLRPKISRAELMACIKAYFEHCPILMMFMSLVQLLIFATNSEWLRTTLVYDPHHRQQLWRFFTYMLLHKDETHLILNVVIQVILAAPLEKAQCGIRTMTVYILGGLGGSMGASVMDPDPYLMGASAGVCALLFSHISHLILNHGNMKYARCRWAAVTLLTITDVLYNMYHFYHFGNQQPRIGWGAHVAGALTGLLVGILFYKGTVASTAALRVSSGATLVLYVTATVVFNFMRAADGHIHIRFLL